jgi:hypothetical protein
MTDRLSVRARIEIARGKLREYQGRLKQLEGRLTVVRARAEQATGRARVRLQALERKLRRNVEATVIRVETAVRALEPQVKKALAQTRTVQRGVRAGLKAGVQAYRRSGKK